MIDEKYLTDAAQDVQEPVWEHDAVIAEMQSVDDPNDTYPGDGKVPTVRTSSGVLDFISDVVEVAGLGEQEFAKIPKPKLDPIRTRELGSDKWRAGKREVTVSASGPILTHSAKRRKVTLVNYGPGIAYISNGSNPAPNSSATVRILVSSATFWAPLTLSTRDDVWAVSASTSTVEIIEEFDMES